MLKRNFRSLFNSCLTQHRLEIVHGCQERGQEMLIFASCQIFILVRSCSLIYCVIINLFSLIYCVIINLFSLIYCVIINLFSLIYCVRTNLFSLIYCVIINLFSLIYCFIINLFSLIYCVIINLFSLIYCVIINLFSLIYCVVINLFSLIYCVIINLFSLIYCVIINLFSLIYCVIINLFSITPYNVSSVGWGRGASPVEWGDGGVLGNVRDIQYTVSTIAVDKSSSYQFWKRLVHWEKVPFFYSFGIEMRNSLSNAQSFSHSFFLAGAFQQCTTYIMMRV